MSVPRRIVAFLDLAAQDAEAARTLAATNNRYAAYHCQQAVEKLIKAVLLHRNVESGTEHRLDVLVDELLDGDPWKAKLRLLETCSPYATAYRYPTWGAHRGGPGHGQGRGGCGRHRGFDQGGAGRPQVRLRRPRRSQISALHR
jgi:hypothetical protein